MTSQTLLRSSIMTTSKPAPRPRELASVKQLAAFCGVSVRTVYDWNSRGIGPQYHRVGVHARYRWADIERWLETKIVEPL